MRADDEDVVASSLAELARSATDLDGKAFDCLVPIVEELLLSVCTAPTSASAGRWFKLACELAFGPEAFTSLGKVTFPLSDPRGQACEVVAVQSKQLMGAVDALGRDARAWLAFSVSKAGAVDPFAREFLQGRVRVEPEPVPMASALVGLSLMPDVVESWFDAAFSRFPEERWVAALGQILGRWRDRRLPEDVALLDAVFSRADLPEEEFPWYRGRLGVFCRDVLIDSGASTHWFMGMLLHVLRGHPADSERVMSVLGECALGHASGWEYAKLSSDVKEALEFFEGRNSRALGRLGFPSDARERRRWAKESGTSSEELWEEIRRLQRADAPESEVLEEIRRSLGTGEEAVRAALALGRGEHELAPLSGEATWRLVLDSGEESGGPIDEFIAAGGLEECSPEAKLCILGWIGRFRGKDALPSLSDIPLWEPYAVCRDLLALMSPEERAARVLRELEAQRRRPTTTVCNAIRRVLPVLDLACTEQVVDTLLLVSSEEHLGRLNSARIVAEARSLVRGRLEELAASRPWLQAKLAPGSNGTPA